MAVKVQIPPTGSPIIARGLFQWDYGQELEIECEEIGSEELEVHFACQNMTEAVVRVCYFSDGVGTVEIPDECLEQTSPINVWIYEVGDQHGRTIKTFALLITQRPRPKNTRDIPVEYEDKYGQLIEEINEAVNALERGDVTVAKARLADTAGHATTAGDASSATFAASAGTAAVANRATHAIQADTAEMAYTRQVETIAVMDGTGTLKNPLSSNFLYGAIINRVSGLFVIKGETTNVTVGDYEMSITDNTITLAGGETVPISIYKIGGISG